jgi:hypothetical protein
MTLATAIVLANPMALALRRMATPQPANLEGYIRKVAALMGVRVFFRVGCDAACGSAVVFATVERRDWRTMRVTVDAEVETDLAPGTIRDALLDFTDRRLELWPQLDPATYQVHWVSETSAEVTEGSPRPKVWSREHYDWSQPTTITWTAVESNFCAPGSYISMDIAALENGGSRVAVTWDRTAANLKGRVALGVVKIGGDRLLRWATRKSLADLAARTNRT